MRPRASSAREQQGNNPTSLGISLLAATLLLFVACAPSVRADSTGLTQVAASIPSSKLHQTGLASWYGPNFAGKRTANGEIFDPGELTAAHRELPFNTLVRVTNDTNGRSVVVRINDRGPFRAGRIVDLSRAGAEAIGMIGAGVAPVQLEVLTLPQGVVRVEATGTLSGFEVISRLHPVGTLMVLSPVSGEDRLVVRVVSQEMPLGTPADVLVGEELYSIVGGEARLHTSSN